MVFANAKEMTAQTVGKIAGPRPIGSAWSGGEMSHFADACIFCCGFCFGKMFHKHIAFLAVLD